MRKEGGKKKKKHNEKARVSPSIKGWPALHFRHPRLSAVSGQGGNRKERKNEEPDLKQQFKTGKLAPSHHLLREYENKRRRSAMTKETEEEKKTKGWRVSIVLTYR